MEAGDGSEGGPAVGDSALVLGCLTDDLLAAQRLAAQHGVALLPAGGLGDLPRATPIDTLLLLEVTANGPRPALTWAAAMLPASPVHDVASLIPPSFHQRHPDALSLARAGTWHLSDENRHLDADAALWDDDDDEDAPCQVFIPVSDVRALDTADWIFANEVVPKQHRRGRRFAPRMPRLVELPD
jgi:hypothetical protein